MKKIIISLAVLFISFANIVSGQVSFSPTPSSQTTKAWFDNFVKNNTEGIKIVCEAKNATDYEDPYEFIVLGKNGRVLFIYNLGDSTFIVGPATPPVNNDECKNFFTELYSYFSANKNGIIYLGPQPVAYTPTNFYNLRRKL